MKSSIRKRQQRCSHGWVMDEWWELRVNGSSYEFGTWELAMDRLAVMYSNGWVR